MRKKTLDWLLKNKKQILICIMGLSLVVMFISLFIIHQPPLTTTPPPPALTYEEVIYYYNPPISSIPPQFQSR